MSELLLIDHYAELEEFELVEEQLLTSLPAYQLYLQRTKKAFEQTKGELEVRPYQWEYAALMAVRPRNIMAYEMGSGKAQPLTSLVYTPTGPISMGEVTVGTKVLTPSGETANVIGVYPQGEKEVYRVTFSDGTFTHCCEDHLWAVRTPVQAHRGSDYKIKSLKEIKDKLKHSNGNRQQFIPLATTIEFTEQDTPLDPYLLGLLLGDGSFRSNRVSFTCPDLELIEAIKSIMPSNLKLVETNLSSRCSSHRFSQIIKDCRGNPIVSIIKQLGLLDKNSTDKFIPKAYLYNNSNVRLAVLQGLLDTDGCVTKNNKGGGIAIEYSTSSYQLAKDAQFIVESLGGSCTVTDRIPKFTYKGEKKEGQRNYRVWVRLPEHFEPFRLHRKRDAYSTVRSVPPHRAMESVELVGKAECQCIAIDHPSHLYLTDHCIVTHNTSVSLLAIQAIYRTFWDRRAGSIHILAPNLLAAQRWVEELERSPEMSEHFELIKSESDLDNCTKPIIIYSLDFPKNRSKHRKGSARPFISRRLAKLYKPAMVVIDEVHNCQPGTQRTSQIKYLLNRAKRVLVLTGTPSEGKLSEIHNLCDLVYGKQWPYSSAQTFSKMFGTKEQLSTNYLYGSKLQESSTVRYLQHLNSEKLVEYYSLIKRFIHRVKLTDPEVKGCITIPTSTSVIHRLEPTLEQRSTHLDYTLKHQKALIVASQAVGVKQKAEALRLLYPLIALCNHNPDSPKLAASGEIIQQAAGKVVVFCAYVKSAALITEYLQNLLGEESVIRVYATDESIEKKKLSSDERVVLVDRFQFDPTIKVGVFSINLTGESINLTAASDVIYYCPPWSVKKLRQSMYRAVRAGNKHQEVKLHFLYHRGLVDEHQVVLATQKIRGSKLLEDYDIDSETTAELTQTEVLKKLLATSN